MKKLNDYLRKVNANIIKQKGIIDEEKIPEVLQKFYSNIKSVELEYGNIWNYNKALEISKAEPFYPNWFVFGKDNYFNFWLCSKINYENNCYFTYWDHESGLEIEEPIWKDLLSFLQAMEKEYNGEW